MILFITILHVFLCVLLVAIVLLQHGKGADVGVVLGGGASQTVFGSRGAGNFLTKLTTGAAILFMATSLTLSRLGTPGSTLDLLQSEMPAEQAAGPELQIPPPSASTGSEAGPGESASDVPSGFEEIPAPPPAPPLEGGTAGTETGAPGSN